MCAFLALLFSDSPFLQLPVKLFCIESAFGFFSICGMAPILSKYLLPRLNPYALLGEFAALMVLIEVFLVDQRYVTFVVVVD